MVTINHIDKKWVYMKKNNDLNLSEKAAEIGIKLERISILMEFMEKALEGEVEVKTKKLVSLSYIINDYLSETTKKFDELECMINNIYNKTVKVESKKL